MFLNLQIHANSFAANFSHIADTNPHLLWLFRIGTNAELLVASTGISCLNLKHGLGQSRSASLTLTQIM
jgi:hypothetical protein